MKKFGFLIALLIIGLSVAFYLESQKMDEPIPEVATEQEEPPTEVNAKKKRPHGLPDYKNVTVNKVIKKDHQHGKGKAIEKPNQKIEIKYEAYIYAPARRANKGRLIQKTEKGKSLILTLGQGKLIPGWEQGLMGMREGGKRELIIPNELAYGDKGIKGKVPPGAIVLVHTELEKVF